MTHLPYRRRHDADVYTWTRRPSTNLPYSSAWLYFLINGITPVTRLRLLKSVAFLRKWPLPHARVYLSYHQRPLLKDGCITISRTAWHSPKGRKPRATTKEDSATGQGPAVRD